MMCSSEEINIFTLSIIIDIAGVPLLMLYKMNKMKTIMIHPQHINCVIYAKHYDLSLQNANSMM